MMKWLLIPAAAGALTLAAAYAAVRVGCYVPPRREADVFSMPDTEQYNVFRAQSEKMIRDALSVPYEDVFITSFDGLRLHAKFYAAPDPKAPVQIMFHGYKSAAERDFCGGLREGIDGGFNVLLVDQRAHGESGRCVWHSGVSLPQAFQPYLEAQCEARQGDRGRKSEACLRMHTLPAQR